jgi:hypothetical protein
MVAFLIRDDKTLQNSLSKLKAEDLIMRSQRQYQVGEELRHALAATFQRGEFH